MQKHLSRMMAILALGLIGSLGLTATSHASLIDFEGSYDVTANSDDPGLVINTSLLNNGELAFSLDESESYTIDLFQIWTEETVINNDDTNPQDITVEFSFTLPESFSGTSQGQTVGQSTTVIGIFNTQSGAVSWNNPASMNFGNDGLLNVSLSDVVFNSNTCITFLGGCGLDEGQAFGATVQGTFTLAQAPSQLAQTPSEVPEPGALALLGLGLLGMGLARQRRTRLLTA